MDLESLAKDITDWGPLWVRLFDGCTYYLTGVNKSAKRALSKDIVSK